MEAPPFYGPQMCIPAQPLGLQREVATPREKAKRKTQFHASLGSQKQNKLIRPIPRASQKQTNLRRNKTFAETKKYQWNNLTRKYVGFAKTNHPPYLSYIRPSVRTCGCAGDPSNELPTAYPPTAFLGSKRAPQQYCTIDCTILHYGRRRRKILRFQRFCAPNFAEDP